MNQILTKVVRTFHIIAKTTLTNESDICLVIITPLVKALSASYGAVYLLKVQSCKLKKH